jgi:predicted ATPase
MMSIQSFTLKNYRSFVDRTTIELRPLTLLFGYNNSGKSALLRTLPLLADSLNGQSRTPLALDSPAVRGSHFSDLLSRITGTQEFDLELSLAESEIQRLKWTLRDMPVLKTHIISSFSAFGSDEIKQLDARWNTESLIGQTLDNDYDIQLTADSICEQALTFKGLLPSLPHPIPSLPANILSSIEQCQKLTSAKSRIQWLSPNRQSPLRKNPFKRGAPKYLEPDGKGAADILAYDSLSDKGLILPKVSHWYEQHLQQKIVVTEQANYFQIMLQHLMDSHLMDSPYKVNIVDVGEGLIQMLPVLVACAMASQGDIDILAIEEPESYLHSRHHIALAAHFCELARQNNPPKVLLETHSENFLLSVQLEIAQRKLDPELVMVYWIRQLDNERSIPNPVTFDQQGRLNGDWERTVFYDELELARQLVQAQRESL